MVEEKNEDIASENDEETEEETSEETPEVTPPVNSEETPKEATEREKELEAKNKKLFARAVKAEDKLKEKKEVKAPEGSDPLVAVQLGKALKDFSDEEVNFICKFANSKNPEIIIEASKNE